MFKKIQNKKRITMEPNLRKRHFSALEDEVCVHINKKKIEGIENELKKEN